MYWTCNSWISQYTLDFGIGCCQNMVWTIYISQGWSRTDTWWAWATRSCAVWFLPPRLKGSFKAIQSAIDLTLKFLQKILNPIQLQIESWHWLMRDDAVKQVYLIWDHHWC